MPTSYSVILVLLVSALILVCRFADSWRSFAVVVVSRWVFVGAIAVVLVVVASSLVKSVHLASTSAASASAVHPGSGSSVVGGPSLLPSFIDRALSLAGSPAAGSGQALYDLSVQYRVDDAYALATFKHESNYGKEEAAAVNHSLGNIICAGYPTCNGRFRWYGTWQESAEDFYRLIAREYVARGLTTLQAILPVYAPSSENNTSAYIQQVAVAMAAFRAGHVSA